MMANAVPHPPAGTAADYAVPYHPVVIPLNALVAAVVAAGYPPLMAALPWADHAEWTTYALGLVLVTLVVDAVFSPATRVNLRTMWASGFSKGSVAAIYAFNFATFNVPYVLLLRAAQVLTAHGGAGATGTAAASPSVVEAFRAAASTGTNATAVFAYASGAATAPWAWPLSVLLPRLLVGVATALATDPVFFLFHKALHDYWPSLHLLHHCCIRSSLTTNLFFHPGDLALEFTAPIMSMWAVAVFVVGDPWVFAFGFALLWAWYTLSHDEWLGLQHARHHRHCGSNYFIYVNWWKDNVANDGVRALLPRRKQVAAATPPTTADSPSSERSASTKPVPTPRKQRK